MTLAKLNILRMEFCLPPLYEFHDHGYVKNLQDKISELEKEYRFKINNPYIKGDMGRCICKVKSFRAFTHIFYLKHKEEIINIFVRAHEESHVLQIFNRFGSLENKIGKEKIFLFKRILSALPKSKGAEKEYTSEYEREYQKRYMCYINNLDLMANVGAMHAISKRYNWEEVEDLISRIKEIC